MSPVIEIKGSESSCSCDALKLDNIVMQYLSEFIDICDGERLVINNSKFNCIDMGANGMLVIQNSDVIEIESSLFTSINRTSGGGGGVAGSIGDGKSMIVRNCTFEQCSSSEVARISGGGLNVEVCDRGSFLFSNNTVNSCCVNEEFGVGGGIHLKFCKEDVTYSMKQISFSDCNAYLGKDVFLICPSPRDVLVIQLWEGTSKEIEDPLNKWVIDVEIDPNINRSVLYFLFPPRLSMVYVKNEGSGDPRCGDDLDPCGDLMFGFNKMSTDQTTIQIIDSCILDEVLDRNGLSLTIRGQSSTSQSTFDIETDGTISLKIEANSASMMLSYLKFNIPMTSSVGHLISIDGGKLFVDECFFGRKDDTMIEADALIVFASKGTIKFSKVSLRKISFKEAGGIISMIGGSLDIENSDWSFLEARASALHLLNNENFKVSENCTFTSCLSDSEEGGFMKCSLQATGKMSIANSSITKSGMIESRGRGGGLHLSLPNGSTNDYLIANVSFVNNSAEFGKDIFIVCDNLNTSITLEQFKIRLMNDDGQKAISMMGNDRNYFNDSAHDLYLFLIQFQSQEIIVSSSGYDMQGCGSEMYPCYSFSRGFSNILQDAVQKRLTIITETYVDHSHVLSSFIIAPSNTLENCSLAVSSTISGVPSESIFLNNDELLVKKAIISLPSFFCSGQKALFLSSSKEEYEDSNVFVGSDAKNKDTNLFRFLVSYSSNVIFISINGSDVSKCGQKFDPCETFWKGMSQIDGNAEKKVMLIENSSFVQNAYDLSNYSFSSANLEKETKSELILKKPETFEILDWIFSCTGTLSFMCIDMQLDETLAEFTGVIINFKGSSVSIENCFLCSSSSIYYLDMKFVSVQSGILKLISFEVHQLKFDSTALEIWSCSSCSLTDVIVLNSVINGGFIRFIDNSTSSGNELPTIEINKSVFQNVSSTINGSCIITCTSTSSCNALINDSLFDACQSEASEKGGVIMFILGSESYYKLHNSKISSCSCSLKNGKGGGVYIKAEGNESLNLTFLKCEFQRNNAWKGRDIFVECWSIEEQINETQFQLDLRPDVYNRFDAIYGCDNRNQNPVDLIDYVTIYQQSTIIVSSSHEKNGTNGRQCGKIENPCLTVELGLRHLIFDYLSRILIDDIGNITSECNIVDMEMKSLGQEKANVMIHPSPFKSRECMILFENNVLIGSICFYLPSDFSSQHSILFLIVSGKTSFQSCGFCGTENISSISPILISSMDSELIFDEAKMSNLNCPRIAECKSGRIQLRQLKLDRIFSSKSTILLKEMNGFAEKLNISNCTIHSGSFFGIESDPSSEWAKVSNSLEFSLINISCISSFDSASCFDCCLHENQLSLQNCSLSGCHQGNVELGSAAIFENCSCLRIKSCLFEGDLMSEGDIEINEISEQSQLCKWNSSLIFFENSVISINDSSISNSSKGGIAASRSTISVSEGKFFNNNPLIQNYSSTRRNIICSNSGVLDITSLKGGDGLKENSSLWVLNLGCSLSGIASERASPFFIPQLASVKSRQQGNTLAIDLAGSLLLPCGLSLQVDSFDGSVHNLQVYPLQAEEFAGEVEIHTAIPASIVTTASEATEVSVKILFGRVESPASTDSFILKNRSEPKANGDERIVEGGKEGKSYWMLIAIVLVVILLIFLIGFILFVVRWKKAKERSDELEEIVKDTVKKDPKLIEMVTMEMSPEAQWRRAEKEAEKKNDERFKKRVIEKSLGHSESSEHLLSESGSTEYILGRDSDKIPQWMLEKVDEKEEDDEETRKRTPSPSISSTCSTDSDSTFVRTESLCPTTSSMSNLVDAMACSSPHEKLIVDLRDSLFMLLHGRNEKKEMAIGSLKEREQTAAQILFWVANLALHSFDEMENPLSSLANLSPHIVLFSEHMVICIAMHSDCSSNGSDSDSSSVFSCSSDCSTVSDDDRNSLPSSAFEDDEDNRYECLRWKAPELQTNKKMGATKESVVFSIGMMLWECLTLKIPFSDYEAELAGQKIQRGDLPNFDMMLTHSSSFSNLVSTSLSFNPSQRPTIENVKRHTIVHFPPDAVLLTASDAIDFQEDESNRDCQSDSCTDKTSLISF
ncbi:uncharacterized protein MONOS_10097 [Monocercomonoides exilis]|uniref:uncharacterized protein n=1 Tax=Monocercomonoides exilis TaxID=2049356 RepID=UPI003559E331|nr:hypothetical protein MONOS_10097 [Monocercomonoides exilis]|eukprot:MONOS_10097.1-p1 / transcript=MONOS_10097.1 / gene=MONOS_10097 / organism=Monocercomonoides_exilis_PA203 / gene_product=unspecified product / transcript_product=unspecified product / location=Mono_scaffold00444:3470-10198(+) / protein_length=2081 / sequence_SO=supercontig / SO=protein_coding / is_pseudo=false